MNDVKKLNVFGVEYDLPEGGGGGTDIGIELIGNESHNGSFVNLNGIISSPVVGSIDGNVIALSGNLAKGTYEVKYMLADGTAADIGTIEVV